MQIERYFDFLAPDDIRIKGHRIGIESVLYEYPPPVIVRLRALKAQQQSAPIAACL